MTDTVEAQASLEAVLKDEIINMYQEVAENPEGEFHFFHFRGSLRSHLHHAAKTVQILREPINGHLRYLAREKQARLRLLNVEKL